MGASTTLGPRGAASQWSDPSRAGVPLHTLVLGHLPEQSVLVGMCAASGARSLRVGARASSRANATPSHGDRALPVTPAANLACSSSGLSVARTVRSAQNCGEAAEGAQRPSGAVMSSESSSSGPAALGAWCCAQCGEFSTGDSENHAQHERSSGWPGVWTGLEARLGVGTQDWGSPYTTLEQNSKRKFSQRRGVRGWGSTP